MLGKKKKKKIPSNFLTAIFYGVNSTLSYNQTLIYICSLTLLTVDVFKSAAWQEMEVIEDPELQELAQLLPTVVLSRSRAPSTVRNYSSAFLRWKSCATQKYDSQACLPAKPLHVALYLTYLVQKSSTSAQIVEASNATSWAHQLTAADDPT